MKENGTNFTIAVLKLIELQKKYYIIKKMWNILTEFVGTFVFLAVILTTGEALPIGLALAAAIYFGGKVSGGHFNPAVSTMMLVKGAINMETWITYVIAQVLGGLVALLWYRSSLKKK